MRLRPRSGSAFLACAVLTILLAASAACRIGTGSYGEKALGGVAVKGEEMRGPLPQRAPSTVYVADFALDAEEQGGEEGVRGVLPGRLGQRVPHPLARDNAAQRAHHIVDLMARSLVQHLEARGVRAARLGAAAGDLPREGWLVQGVFTEVDEGNRLKRAVIGFGRGATSMDLQIGISDLAGPDPRASFAVFGTVKDPSRIPGAAVTRNPYVAAAKFVLEKNAGERDIARTAERIAGEIVKLEEQSGPQARPADR